MQATGSLTCGLLDIPQTPGTLVLPVANQGANGTDCYNVVETDVSFIFRWYFKGNLSWSEADRRCESHGMSLPRIHSYEDLSMLFDMGRILNNLLFQNQIVIFVSKVL